MNNASPLWPRFCGDWGERGKCEQCQSNQGGFHAETPGEKSWCVLNKFIRASTPFNPEFEFWTTR